MADVVYVLPPFVYFLFYILIALVIGIFAEFGFFYYFMGYIGRATFAAGGNISIHITEQGGYFIKKDRISSVPGWLKYKIGKIWKWYPVRQGSQAHRSKAPTLTIVLERGGIPLNARLALYTESLTGTRNDYIPANPNDPNVVPGPLTAKPSNLTDIALNYRETKLKTIRATLPSPISISFAEWVKENPKATQKDYDKMVGQVNALRQNYAWIDDELAIIQEIRTGQPRKAANGQQATKMLDEEKWQYVLQIANDMKNEKMNLLPAEIGGISVNMQTFAEWFENLVRPYDIIAHRDDAVEEYKQTVKKGENIMKYAIAALIVLVGAAVVLAVAHV